MVGGGLRDVAVHHGPNVVCVDVTDESNPHFVWNYFDTVVYGVSKYHFYFKHLYKKLLSVHVYKMEDKLGQFDKSPYVASDFGVFLFIDYVAKNRARITLFKFAKDDVGDILTLVNAYFKKIDYLFRKHLFKPCPFVYESSILNGDYYDIVMRKKHVLSGGEGRDMERCLEYSERTCLQKNAKKRCTKYTKRTCLKSV